MAEKKSSFGLGKKLNLSHAQQVLLLAVLASSVVLGVSISISLNFLNKISFNVAVIMEKDQAIEAYSSALAKIGVCKKPKDGTYSESELKNCNPSTIDINSIPGTLRHNIVNGLAVNSSLNSVPKDTVDSRCVDGETGKNYSIKQLNDMYVNAETIEDREAATGLLKVCSALRVIPDALPSFNNMEAMLSSLNKIFILSGWQPDGLAPVQDSNVSENEGINGYGVMISVEASPRMVQEVVLNTERSIRDIEVVNAAISYGSEESIKVDLTGAAFYVDKTVLSEQTKTIDPKATKGKKK